MNDTENKRQSSIAKKSYDSSKTVEFDYPGCEGFKVSSLLLGERRTRKTKRRCVTQNFNRKTRSYEEVMDDDKFLFEYTKAVIKGWKGFKLATLKTCYYSEI